MRRQRHGRPVRKISSSDHTGRKQQSWCVIGIEPKNDLKLRQHLLCPLDEILTSQSLAYSD